MGEIYSVTNYEYDAAGFLIGKSTWNYDDDRKWEPWRLNSHYAYCHDENGRLTEEIYLFKGTEIWEETISYDSYEYDEYGNQIA